MMPFGYIFAAALTAWHTLIQARCQETHNPSLATDNISEMIQQVQLL